MISEHQSQWCISIGPFTLEQFEIYIFCAKCHIQFQESSSTFTLDVYSKYECIVYINMYIYYNMHAYDRINIDIRYHTPREWNVQSAANGKSDKSLPSNTFCDLHSARSSVRFDSVTLLSVLHRCARTHTHMHECMHKMYNMRNGHRISHSIRARI